MALVADLQQAEIRIVGVVQGIGFRPFIYAQAIDHELVGYVLNTGNSAVLVVVEGKKNNIIDFIESIEKNKPHLSMIDSIQTIWRKPSEQFTDFQIHISKNERKAGGSIIPPDVAVCEDCIEDINSPQSRHYQYPMTCCAICGPRYTTIIDTPYDRERTTMDSFPLCSDCDAEFNNPLNRRFNAQTICCPNCGPKFQLLDSTGEVVKAEDVFNEVTSLLNEGAIVAVKGLGGIHLAVRASLEEQVQRLRSLRNKPYKPLAIMAPDLDAVRQFATISPLAETLLISWRRPIVVLNKRDPFPLAHSLAPGLDTIGVMLPYSGIYLRLFEDLHDSALVMTSANPSRLPTIIQATTFQEHFMKLADYFLTHNRTIHQRCDDSVIIPFSSHGLIIRRSRGYSPEPIDTANNGPPILALGALEKNTGAVYHKTRIYLTQHIGDIDTLETLRFLQESLTHLQTLLRVNAFDAIACDLHPDFLTTQYAAELSDQHDIPLIRVQHHHAHLAALLADHRLPIDEEIVAICSDGAGFGPDNTTWGGEILVGNANTYTRAGYLQPQPMPGGDLAAKYPLRMLIGILSAKYSTSELNELFTDIAPDALPQGITELNTVLAQVAQKINTPLTSSTGRILDSIAAMLQLSYHRTYEGEPAIRLESYANKGKSLTQLDLQIPIIKKGSVQILDTSQFINQIFENRFKYSGPDLAYESHRILGRALGDVAIDVADVHGLRAIGFSGGVAYNKILTNTIKEAIEEEGLVFLNHRHVPPGDAGTAVGQAYVARASL
ncbi:MAG: carbamoyltransferase HypF [Candidatus Hodarchaeota archaeon]